MARSADAEPWLHGLVEVAEVGRPHGTAGELSVHAHADDPENLLEAEFVHLDGWPGTIRYAVEHALETGRAAGRVRVRLKLAGIDSRERAEAWTAARVFLDEAALRPLPPGEFYLRDLIGLACVTTDGIALGFVREIWPVADCDQLLVEGEAGDLFVPATDEVLVEVDRANARIRVALPEGAHPAVRPATRSGGAGGDSEGSED